MPSFMLDVKTKIFEDTWIGTYGSGSNLLMI